MEVKYLMEIRKLQKCGNSVSINLPSPYVKAMGASPGSQVQVTLTAAKWILIKPVKIHEQTEAFK